jgi:hypothetical protein
MKRIRWFTIVSLLFPAVLLALLFLVPHQPAAAQGATVLRIEPPELTIDLGETGTNAVQMVDVDNFYGGEFAIEYDKDCVEVVDADPNTPGVQIGVGALFTDQGLNYFVARNWVYTDTGRIEFEATLRDPAPPFTGTGTLATITWRCTVDDCSSAVTLTMSKLANHPDGRPISHTVENDGTIRCVPNPGISGTVLLQGRDNHSGTYVFMTIAPCPTVVHVTSLDIPIPDVPSAVTDDQGRFEINPYPDRSGSTDYKCLQAIHRGYLVGQKTLPPYGDLGTITLLGGDATEDDQINIFDLALVAARYGEDDPIADINGNGVVDIYDLVVVAGNYGAHGPQTDWH